jgi:hypothetical protein
MLLVDAAAFLVLMVLCFARETPLGRWLDAGLVQRPARWLGGIGRGFWICAGCVVLVVGGWSGWRGGRGGGGLDGGARSGRVVHHLRGLDMG